MRPPDTTMPGVVRSLRDPRHRVVDGLTWPIVAWRRTRAGHCPTSRHGQWRRSTAGDAAHFAVRWHAGRTPRGSPRRRAGGARCEPPGAVSRDAWCADLPDGARRKPGQPGVFELGVGLVGLAWPGA